MAGYFLPKEVDWSPSFSMDHTQPYGCRVLYEELPTLFYEGQFSTNVESFYESRDEMAAWGSNLIMIDEYLDLDSLEIQELINYISEGNTVLMSAYDFPGVLLDTFGLMVQSVFRTNDIIRGGFEGTELSHQFVADSFKSESGFVMMVDANTFHFMAIDSVDKCVGLAWADKPEKVNFVKKSIGAGQLFLHSNPYIFSNFNMLSADGSKYVGAVLSHLPRGGLVWDEYHKKINLTKKASILSVLLRDPALKKAVYLSILGIILILLFMSKRRQRIIRPVEVFSNDSKELVSTIGNMFYNTSNNKEIAEKKIKLFKVEMFRKHGLRDIHFNDFNVQRISERTSISKDEVASHLGLISQILDEEHISDQKLKQINDIINKITHGKQ